METEIVSMSLRSAQLLGNKCYLIF